MPFVAVSVPSGSHHRSFLLPMRDALTRETTWLFLVISPGAPWSNQLFPFSDYPRDRFSFVDNGAAERVLADVRPALVITTTTGLDANDALILEAAQRLGLRTATFVESWDNVWKMERVARGLGKPGQRIVLPDFLLVWNEIMKRHALRAFPKLSRLRSPGGDATGGVPRSEPQQRDSGEPSDAVGWGKSVAAGPTGDCVFVTGSPRLDAFGPHAASQLPPRAVVMESLGFKSVGRFLHLATTELYDHSHVAKTIADAKRRGDLPNDLQLYASVHPGGNMERHKPWADAYGFSIRFSPGRREPTPHPDFRYNPTKQDTLRLAATFKEADVMVNLSSTAALESCLADCPTICAFFGKPFDWIRWRRSMVVRDFREHYADLLAGGGIAVARSPAQLVAQIRAYLDNPAQDREGRRRSAERIATTLAGDASERVMRVLKSLLL